MRWAQRRLGPGLAWLFVGPNLAVFGLFTFLPIVLNVWYAATSGTNLLPGDRPWAGLGNMRALLACGSYLDPSSCQRDLFWHLRASHNCGTKCHVPALEEGVETAETPGDGFRAGWLVAA